MHKTVQMFRERVLAEGLNLGDGILKIDSLLNHQLDPQLMMLAGEYFAEKFADAQVDRILSVEVSGIAPALVTGYALKVPVVYARKTKPVTMFGPIFLETAPSHTKGVEVNLMVAAEFMQPGQRILIIDDFLASGKTLISLVRMVRSARCELVGIACVVEKIFEEGRSKLEKYGVPIDSIVKIASMDDGKITLANE